MREGFILLKSIELIVPSLPGYDDLNARCKESYLDTAESPDDVIFTLIENEKTFAVNVNSGLDISRGDYLGVINNDSIGLPGWDEHIRSQEVDGVYSLSPRVDCGWAFIMPRKVFDKVGLLDTKLHNSYDDYDYFVRAALHGYKRIAAPQNYALHEGSITLQKNWGTRDNPTQARLITSEKNKQYMLEKWPNINIDAVPHAAWNDSSVEIMKEWMAHYGKPGEI